MIRSKKKREVNYHTTYWKVSAKKTMRTVNVKGESVVKGGKCTTEKMSPWPRTITGSGDESETREARKGKQGKTQRQVSVGQRRDPGEI